MAESLYAALLTALDMSIMSQLVVAFTVSSNPMLHHKILHQTVNGVVRDTTRVLSLRLVQARLRSPPARSQSPLGTVPASTDLPSPSADLLLIWQIIAHSVTHTVTHSIIHHYYCIYCYFHGEYCNYCYCAPRPPPPNPPPPPPPPPPPGCPARARCVQIMANTNGSTTYSTRRAPTKAKCPVVKAAQSQSDLRVYV